MTMLRYFAASLLLAACLHAQAQTASTPQTNTNTPSAASTLRTVHPDLPKTDIPFERLLSQPYLAGSPPSDVRWAKDNHHIAFRWNPEGKRLRDIYVMDVPNGKPVRLTDGAKITRLARQDDERTEEQKKEEIQYDAGPGTLVWSPDSKTLLFGYRGDIFEVGVDGKTAPRRRTMLTEGVGQLDYSPDGRFISYTRGGNVYLMERQTGDIRQLTTVSKVGTAVSGYDWSPDGKKVELTGSLSVSAPTFATGAGLRGTHPSEDGERAILDAQDRTPPPDIYFTDVSNVANASPCQSHQEPRRLTVSQLPDFACVPLINPQEVTFAAADGKMLHGLLWLPADTQANTNSSVKHGAIVSIMYADSAKDRWGGLLQSYMASALNMVVLGVDFRSSWGYGADFATGYYKSLGQVDADEAVAAANYLKSQSYVDGSRVGLWGWSYGGFLTEMVMFTRPGVFAAGVAVAPVTDWKHYNRGTRATG